MNCRVLKQFRYRGKEYKIGDVIDLPWEEYQAFRKAGFVQLVIPRRWTVKPSPENTISIKDKRKNGLL